MKRALRWICLILVLCLLPLTALAEGILRRGDSGDEVLAMQLRLAELGYTQTETDGIFGEGTEKALLAFQQANGLLCTGMADEPTLRALMSDEAVSKQEVFVEALSDLMCGAVNTTARFGMPMMVEEFSFDTREYTTFAENGFLSTATSPLSTFAADVDTASWAQVRQRILRGEPVPADSVRVEEMLNYFHYHYNAPADGAPFGVTFELGDCPWNSETKLLLIGLQAEAVEKTDVPSNLVFLIDVSGSMDEPEKLPLVKRAFLLLLEELNPADTVSIVTYASYDTVVLDGVPAANKVQIMEAINDLCAGGGTNGSDGILTAYALAEKHFVEGGNNRILLATDGDLNVGITTEGDLARLVSEKKEGGVALTVLGFGGDNYKDNRMEALADYGDGSYHYIDTIHEARRALITEGGGTFNTVAKDVKLQADFNPAKVKGYRLIGYEDRLLNAEDFADDAVDGGEIGSGHRVTALYELVPTDSTFDFGAVESKYAKVEGDPDAEWLTLSVRAKAPDGDESVLYTYPLDDAPATENLRFAAAVAEVAMLLRDSEWKGASSYDDALTLLRGCDSVTGDPYKEELVYLVGLLQREGD